jgi:ELWxxDGT repeat protein
MKPIAVFESGSNLWVTDGTSVGTSELAVSGAAIGVFPTDLTGFGSLALFVAEDANSHPNLWVTDGTSAGTRELVVAGAGAGGLIPAGLDPYFTVLGGEVLFAGVAPGRTGLWVTDGTAAGTKEITVSGAGLDPNHLTVFGNKVIFAGGEDSVWVTDGTSAGTRELISRTTPPLLFPVDPHFTAFGGIALFRADDAPGGLNLWVTDGTSAGTSELNVAGHGSFGLGSAVNPDFTAVGNLVLFNGPDASGHFGLWVTNGTSAGTSELTVSRTSSQGLFGALNPEFTVLGNEVVFEGYDSTHPEPNLWVTDGTAAGTTELNVAGAFSNGLLDVVNPDLTLFGNKVLFWASARPAISASGSLMERQPARAS